MRNSLCVIVAAATLTACGGGAVNVVDQSSSAPVASSSVIASSSIPVITSSSAPVASSSVSSSAAVSSSVAAISSSSSIVASSSAAALKTIFAINAGATTSAVLNSITYSPEGDLAPMLLGGTNGSGSTPLGIAGTNEDALYQTQRYGIFTYQLPVTQGSYNVTLHLAEQFAEGASTRIMSVVAEGKVVMDNVDLYDMYSGNYKAIDVSLNDIEVNDGSLTIEFTAATNLATVSGILVTSVDGAAGEVVAPPKPCEGTDKYVCLDFEDVAAGAIPAGWSYDGISPKVDTTKAHSGTKSLKAQGKDYGSSGYITYPNIPSKHWGRMYYQMGSPLQTVNYLHITLVELMPLNSGFSARVVDTNLASSDLSKMKYILNVDANGNEGGLSSDTKFSYYTAVDNWVCVEWMVDPSTQKGALWADGVLAYNDVLSHPSPNQIPATSFNQIRIGMRTYKGAMNSVWIDDVVVGPTRIGCN